MGGVYDYDTTPADNGATVGGISIAEGGPAANINNAIRQMAADLADLLLDVGCATTTAGTADALTLTTNGTIDSNRDGILLGFIAGVSANAAATLNVDSQGAKALRRYNDQALEAGDILQNGAYLVAYDASANGGSGAWLVLNPSGVEAGSVNTAAIADEAVTNAKLAHMAQATLKGRAAGAGTGDATDLTAAQLVDIIETADGAGSGIDADLLDGQQGSYYTNANNISAGTIPDARFPATLPAANGSNLTSLNATALTGTISDARLSNNVPLLDASSNDFTGDASFDGNVGIGTTSPETRLHVRNGGSGATFANNTGFLVENNGTGANYKAFQIATAGANKAFAVMNDGNVGIGTTAPDGLLHLAASSPSLYIEETNQPTDEKLWRILPAGGALAFQTVNDAVSSVNTAINIIRSGATVDHVTVRPRLGVNKDNPSTTLDVNGDAQFVGSLGTFSVDTTGARIKFNRPSINYIQLDDPLADLVIEAEDSTFLMRVNQDGNVGIGTASPETRLHVRNGDSGATFANNTGLLVENNGTSASFKAFQIATAGANEAFAVTNAGNVGIGTTNPSTTLHVGGPARVGSYTVATVPSASTVGAGTIIYVSNETGGAVLAFSDGTNWRRVTDRATIS